MVVYANQINLPLDVLSLEMLLWDQSERIKKSSKSVNEIIYTNVYIDIWTIVKSISLQTS